MMKMNINKDNATWVIVFLFTIFTFGVGVGYNSKKRPKIESTKIVLDTVYRSYPINVERIVKVPINKVKHDTLIIVKKGKSISVKDTIFKVVNNSYTSVDTLKHDSIFVSLKDSANCNGILKREYQFFGSIKEREIIKTITNNIVMPQPLLQLNLGVMASFDNRFNKPIDVSPLIQLEYRKKHQASYSYGLNNKQHNFSVSTKIK